MEKSADSTHPDFWTIRYAAGKTPWDFGGVPAALKSFLASIFYSRQRTDPGLRLWIRSSSVPYGRVRCYSD